MIQQQVEEIRFEQVFIQKFINRANKTNKIRDWLTLLKAYHENNMFVEKDKTINLMHFKFVLNQQFWLQEINRKQALSQLNQNDIELMMLAVDDGYYEKAAQQIFQILIRQLRKINQKKVTKLRATYLIAKMQKIISIFQKTKNFFPAIRAYYKSIKDQRKIREYFYRQLKLGYQTHDILYDEYVSWQKNQTQLLSSVYIYDSSKQAYQLRITSLNSQKQLNFFTFFEPTTYIKLVQKLQNQMEKLRYLRIVCLSKHELVNQYFQKLQFVFREDQQYVLKCYQNMIDITPDIQLSYLRFLVKRFNKHVLGSCDQQYNTTWSAKVQFFRQQIVRLINKPRLTPKTQQSIRQLYYNYWVDVQTALIKDKTVICQLYQAFLQLKNSVQIYTKYSQSMIKLNFYADAKQILKRSCQAHKYNYEAYKIYQNFIAVYGNIDDAVQFRKLKQLQKQKKQELQKQDEKKQLQQKIQKQLNNNHNKTIEKNSSKIKQQQNNKQQKHKQKQKQKQKQKLTHIDKQLNQYQQKQTSPSSKNKQKRQNNQNQDIIIGCFIDKVEFKMQKQSQRLKQKISKLKKLEKLDKIQRKLKQGIISNHQLEKTMKQQGNIYDIYQLAKASQRIPKFIQKPHQQTQNISNDLLHKKQNYPIKKQVQDNRQKQQCMQPEQLNIPSTSQPNRKKMHTDSGNTLFIKGFPSTFRQPQIQNIIKNKDKIKQIRLIQKSGVYQSYCYVDMISAEQAEKEVNQNQHKKQYIVAISKPPTAYNQDKTLFLAALPNTTTIQKIKSLFEQQSQQILDVRLKLNENKNIAYIDFLTPQIAKNVFKKYQNKKLFIDDRRIILKISNITKPTPIKKQFYVIILKQLSFKAKQKDIIKFFQDFNIIDVYIPLNDNGTSRGYAYVKFKNQQQFNQVLQMKSGNIKGRPFQIYKSDRDITKPNKQKNQQKNQIDNKFFSNFFK